MPKLARHFSSQTVLRKHWERLPEVVLRYRETLVGGPLSVRVAYAAGQGGAAGSAVGFVRARRAQPLTLGRFRHRAPWPVSGGALHAELAR